MNDFQSAELPVEQRLALHEGLLVWLEWQARNERNLIRRLRSDAATEQQRREVAHRGLGFTVEADRAGLTWTVHRGDCGFATSDDVVDAPEARAALSRPDGEAARPCEVCNPLAALRDVPPPTDPWASA
ncbi:DUF6233 domain-containing protein [Streptomyces sp. NPDC088785]|uniref:DUF6233 domain-containing protein n=1 Tax=Streptomyces sp. NPDC088785 TaxID=3365897 RepID=UPI0037FC8654